MSEPQLFQYDGRDIRAGQDEQGKWVVAKDLCDVLGVQWRGTDSLRHVPEEWRGVRSVRTPSGEQNMAVLYQEGMNFFLFRSDKPAALPFQKWLAGEVLPAIQNDGSYTLVPAASPASPIQALRLVLDALEASERRVTRLESQITTQAHRIDSLDTVNIEGALDQRLNGMIRLYARRAGVPYETAWKQFTTAYNNAFRRNLEERRNHASIRVGRKLTRPEYLKVAGELEEAIRIADKMLNSLVPKAN